MNLASEIRSSGSVTVNTVPFLWAVGLSLDQLTITLSKTMLHGAMGVTLCYKVTQLPLV